MDLDDRARRAAGSLRRSVDADLDIAFGHRAVAGATADRRDRIDRRRRLTWVGALGAVALVGALALTWGVAPRDPGGDSARDPGRNVDVDGDSRPDRSAADRAIIAAMPSSPIDGKGSWRLPVIAEPQSGLRDGDVVTIYGRGFGPNESLGMVMCTAEADTGNEGVGACQLAGAGSNDSYGGVTYASADGDGNVVASFTVRRYVTTAAGRIDCYSAAERCLVGMGAINNYDQSGGSYIDFADAPAFALPSATVEPAGTVAPGTPVAVQVRDWVPGRAIRLQQCIEDRCQNLLDGQAGSDGSATLTIAPQAAIVVGDTGEQVACEDRCTLRVNGIGTPGASSAPLPPDIPLRFTPADPAVELTPATPPTTTAPTATTATTATTAPAEPDGTTATSEPAPSATTAPVVVPPLPGDPGTETGDPTADTGPAGPSTTGP